MSTDRQTADLRAIANELGLSISTISRALKGDPKVTPGTQARVNEVADRLGYRRNLRGVNLRTGKTFTLCALLTSNPTADFGDPAAMHLIQGLIAGTTGTEFKVVIRPVESTEDQLRACRDTVADGRFDGFILDHTEPNDARVQYLLERGLPVMTFGRTGLEGHGWFDIDDEDAALVATRHLIAAGHRRIALIGPPQRFAFAGQRLKGYCEALEEAGIPYDPDIVIAMDISVRSVRERVAELMAIPNRPTGFVSSNELATLGTIRACRDLAADDYAHCGFVSRDGTNLFDYLQPPVSSMYFPLLEAGRLISAGLVSMVQDGQAGMVKELRKAELIPR
jgi:LacI family transcriptional regulator